MDDDGCLFYLITFVIAAVVIMAIIWLVIQVAMLVGAAMGVLGVAYGGGLACKNYGTAFKHNVVDSNRA